MLSTIFLLPLLRYLDSAGANEEPSVERFPLCHSSRAHSAHSHLPTGSIGHTIAVLPGVGARAELLLTNISATDTLLGSVWELETERDTATVCALRIEACANCLISMNFEPIDTTDSFNRQISRCDDPGISPVRACFNIEIVEERADRPFFIHRPFSASPSVEVPNFYAKLSPLGSPLRGRAFNSSSSSLLVLTTLRNLAREPHLLSHVERLFPIRISTFDNTEVIEGEPLQSVFDISSQSAVGFIHSPRFPDAYPRTLLKNYTLVNRNASGFVRLVFDDAYYHYLSEMRILDSDGKELYSSRREHRRPPALVSSGNKLTVRFSANEFSQLVGFKAHYEFVDSRSWPDKPNAKSCDEYIEVYGGRVTLDGQRQLVNTHVDCVWLIGRFPAISRSFDHIYLKVEEFRLKGMNLRLEVRRGSSSIAEHLMTLFCDQTAKQLSSRQPTEGFITHPEMPAFYIRLRGYVSLNEGMSLVFAHFYRWATALCPGSGEFHCDNSKCIKASLRCDGFDHCGDRTDEVCHLPDVLHDMDNFNVTSLLVLGIGMASTMLVLVIIVALVSRIARRHAMSSSSDSNGLASAENVNSPRPNPAERCGLHRARHSTRDESNSGGRGGAATANEAAPTIQVLGDRRFYVLPARSAPNDHVGSISVIEAPPTYADAIKHSIPSGEIPRSSAFNNLAFRMSPPELRTNQCSTAGAADQVHVFPESSQDTSASRRDDGNVSRVSAMATKVFHDQPSQMVQLSCSLPRLDSPPSPLFSPRRPRSAL